MMRRVHTQKLEICEKNNWIFQDKYAKIEEAHKQ